MKPIVLSAFLFVLSMATIATGDIRVMVKEVKDTRTTGSFFAGLELKLTVLGDDLSGARGVKARVIKATDDTGRDLLKEKGMKDDFEQPDDQGKSELTLQLKNPSRNAKVVKELAGELDIYVPRNDSGAVSTIKDIVARGGKTLSEPSLKKVQVDIAVLTKKQFNEMKKQKKKEAKKDLGDTLLRAFEELFGALTDIGENSIILNVKDPDKKVITIEFSDAKGKKINNPSRMSMGEMRIFEFSEPLPPKAQMVVYVSTPKSFLTRPFSLGDIVLP